jgi:hypothetical protein
MKHSHNATFHKYAKKRILNLPALQEFLDRSGVVSGRLRERVPLHTGCGKLTSFLYGYIHTKKEVSLPHHVSVSGEYTETGWSQSIKFNTDLNNITLCCYNPPFKNGLKLSFQSANSKKNYTPRVRRLVKLASGQ